MSDGDKTSTHPEQPHSALATPTEHLAYVALGANLAR